MIPNDAPEALRPNRRSRRTLLAPAALLLAAGCASMAPPADTVLLRQQVMETERAFAHTMTHRDFTTFLSFLSDEAIFFSGETVSRGAEAIAISWRPYFEGPEAPFSWEPDRVEVLESGSLALSTGPVYDADRKQIGRFNSIWRRESAGTWRIVFDRGSPVCP